MCNNLAWTANTAASACQVRDAARGEKVRVYLLNLPASFVDEAWMRLAHSNATQPTQPTVNGWLQATLTVTCTLRLECGALVLVPGQAMKPPLWPADEPALTVVTGLQLHVCKDASTNFKKEKYGMQPSLAEGSSFVACKHTKDNIRLTTGSC